jgi:small-conductance mechanosensitive channel
MGKNTDDKLEAMRRERAALTIRAEEARAQIIAERLNAKYGPDTSEPEGEPTMSEEEMATELDRQIALNWNRIAELQRQVVKLEEERDRLKRGIETH